MTHHDTCGLSRGWPGGRGCPCAATCRRLRAGSLSSASQEDHNGSQDQEQDQGPTCRGSRNDPDAATRVVWVHCWDMARCRAHLKRGLEVAHSQGCESISGSRGRERCVQCILADSHTVVQQERLLYHSPRSRETPSRCSHRPRRRTAQSHTPQRAVSAHRHRKR
jgi:hypothetical protein